MFLLIDNLAIALGRRCIFYMHCITALRNNIWNISLFSCNAKLFILNRKSLVTRSLIGGTRTRDALVSNCRVIDTFGPKTLNVNVWTKQPYCINTAVVLNVCEHIGHDIDLV